MQKPREFPLVAWLSGVTEVYDKGGENFYIKCPVCRSKKLGVHRTKMLFHCFKCDEGGHGGSVWSGKSDLLGFVKLVENISTHDAALFLGSLSGIPDRPAPAKKTTKPNLLPTGVLVSGLWEDHLARRYLKRRHVEHLTESALYVESRGDYQNRIVFPTAYLGKSTGFEARALADWQYPKALFPDWQDTVSLYTNVGWKGTGRVVVTESLLDAETFHGIEDAAGAFGIFNGNQLESLLGLDPTAVVWALDADQNKRLHKFVSYTFGIVDTFVLPLKGNEDPNSIGPEECAKRLENLIHIKSMWDVYALSNH